VDGQRVFFNSLVDAALQAMLAPYVPNRLG
jgi:hypothetical protein